jgi:DNA polymerase III subunit epsilon
LKRWFAGLFDERDAFALRAARWVVIDCETSGLDPSQDRLLSIGAIAVQAGRVDLGEAFEVVLQQATASDPSNILVHGIGGEAQRTGRPMEQGLRAFSAFLASGVPVAFHAPFDAAVLERAHLAHALQPPRRWLDAAQLANSLYPRSRPAKLKHGSLDDWLADFGIASPSRHNALGDAYATAQLFLVLLAEAERQGVQTVADLRRIERSARWVS